MGDGSKLVKFIKISMHQNMQVGCHDIVHFGPLNHKKVFNSAFNDVGIVVQFVCLQVCLFVRRYLRPIPSKNSD